MKNHRYTSVAIVLHWALAILILGQIAGGLYMHNLPNDSSIKFDLFQLHKSFGFSILFLTVIRLGWRLGHKPPPLPFEMPAWQKTGARMTHWGFYALMVLTPLVGWAMVSVSPLDIPTKLFGLVPIPHLPFFTNVADAGASEDLFKKAHELLAKSTLVLFVLHVAAALKHNFIDKDGVFKSMAPSVVAQWAGVFAILGFLSIGTMLYFAVQSSATQSTLTHDSSDGPSNWSVDYDASQLVFVGMEKDRKFEGRFSDFRAQVNFDTGNLDGSAVEVIVGTGSATTGDTLRDSTIPEKEWFDVAQYPSAVFSSRNILENDDGSYRAVGTLQIKEFILPVTLAFSMSQNGDVVIAKGSTNLTRTDFGLGLNQEWLSAEGVALSVEVKFEIHATQLP